MTNNVVRIEQVRSEDFNQYYKIRSEKKNLYWTGYDSAPDYNGFQKWFEGRIADPDRYLFLVYLNDSCIGSLNIDYYKDHAAIGYSIMEAYEGQGLATKVVEGALLLIKNETGIRTSVSRVIAWINESNAASSRVAIKNGMQRSNEQNVRTRFGNEEIYHQYYIDLR